MEKEVKRKSLVKWFSELSHKDIPVAGGKGASLAEMYNNKFPVPPGFVITAEAYKYFIEKSGLYENIMTLLKETDVDNTSMLDNNAKKIRELVSNSEMPSDLKNEIVDAYGVLDVDKKKFSGASEGALDILKNSHEPPFVAVRSSATTEDLADASFAGQQETFLNVKGDEELIQSVKKAFASLFTARAIYYRNKRGFQHEQSYLAVVVQKMIDAEKSGVMFSKNPLKDDETIMIESVWGLGEGIVSGKISPDHYLLNKELEVVDRKVSEKKIALVRSSSGKTEVVNLTPEISSREVLTGHELKMLGQFAQRLEEHYKKPQDIEFSIDKDGIYIIQSRPITTVAKKDDRELGGNVLLSGLPASPGISSGVVKIVHSLNEMEKVQKGNVLVTKMTNPDMVVTMQRSVAIVTDEGGVTSHAAIVSREMGIPAVVGTKSATEKLKDGQLITVDGFTGRVIEGEGIERKVEIKEILPTKTIKIKAIVDLPDYAERAAESGVKSVGLVRLEAVLATTGKHPVWYVKNDNLKEYISNIYDGLRKISQPFEEVWIRSSDIRSDEYNNLEGAPDVSEMNPMLGDHGIRFSLKNQEFFKSELMAIKELADEYSGKKFGVMIPQLISVEELKEAKRIASEVNFPSNVKFGIMVETPAAVQLINELCEVGIDFVSLGTNDLTQYTLALDRNNEEVQDIYDEMNPAVLNSISYVLRRCKKYGVETSICGQAGSRPEMAKFLFENGINSISVNADAAYTVSKLISELENASVVEEKKVELVGDLPIVEKEPMANTREILVNPVEAKSEENVKEEDLILQALGDERDEKEEKPDEYSPSLGERKEDVPNLNEAIPISSEHFKSSEKKDEEYVFDTKDETSVEEKEVFETQSEEVFDEEIKKEVEENLPPKEEFGPKDEVKSEKKNLMEDEFLDIF